MFGVEGLEAEVTIVHKHCWEVFGLHVISGLGDSWMAEVSAQSAMIFPIFRISFQELIQITWMIQRYTYKNNFIIESQKNKTWDF